MSNIAREWQTSALHESYSFDNNVVSIKMFDCVYIKANVCFLEALWMLHYTFNSWWFSCDSPKIHLNIRQWNPFYTGQEIRIIALYLVACLEEIVPPILQNLVTLQCSATVSGQWFNLSCDDFHTYLRYLTYWYWWHFIKFIYIIMFIWIINIAKMCISGFHRL